MRIATFERKIKHLDQGQILTGAISSLNKVLIEQGRIQDLNETEALTGAISSLNKILVEQGIVKERELQEGFLTWMEDSGLVKKRTTRSRRPQ